MPSADVNKSPMLQQFTSQAEVIWQGYLDHGPGHVESSAYATLATYFAGASEETSQPVTASISRIAELSQKIACTPQGLCFLSGEAGLVPRRDLHAEFEQHLHILQTACDSRGTTAS